MSLLYLKLRVNFV